VGGLVIATLLAPECDDTPRAGTLGIGAPKTPTRLGPYETLAELTRRTGHDLELVSREWGYYVWDHDAGDALGEGATREAALDCAEENA
jgi:hypothetical protein